MSTWPPTRARASLNSSNALPKSGSGKVMWRELQEQQAAPKS